MKPGPLHTYPYGRPLFSGDRGALAAAFSVNAESRRCLLEFGTCLTWLVQPPDQAAEIAKLMRDRITAAFGVLPVNPLTFPFRIEIRDQLVYTHLGMSVSGINGNPELFLVWADKLEECVSKLKVA